MLSQVHYIRDLEIYISYTSLIHSASLGPLENIVVCPSGTADRSTGYVWNLSRIVASHA